MFEILVTIAGSLDDEAEALALAQDLEDYIVRARRLGIAVEVWDTRLAQAIRKRVTLPA